VIRLLADQEQLTAKGSAVNVFARGDKNLLHHRLGRGCRGTNIRFFRIGGDAPPADELLPLADDELFYGLFAQVPLGFVLRQKDLADGISANPRQFGIEQPLGLGTHQLIGNGGEHPRAVAGIRFAAACAPVIHIAQGFGGIADDAVAADPLHVGDEADAATVLFVGRVIEPVFYRKIVFELNRHKSPTSESFARRRR
jgi:hypothetical protein